MKLICLLPIPLLVFLGLNYRQLYSALAIRRETSRLEKTAVNGSDAYGNPKPLEDKFEGVLSPDFWNFSLINGAGKVSHEDAWHSTALTLHEGLTVHHIPDLDFNHENAFLTHQPAAEQYNNLTLIGARGFRPTPSSDVVLKFSSRVSETFYGTAGVIFQPVGTLQNDGMFVKPFNMFGFSVAGQESSILGVNGALCYLALNWMPVKVNPLAVNEYAWHEYEIRMRWISKTEWAGSVNIDGEVICEMNMPAFGPLEVHVWSDNSLVLHRPRRWWEIGPSSDLKFQDGGDKQFSLGYMHIFAEDR